MTRKRADSAVAPLSVNLKPSRWQRWGLALLWAVAVPCPLWCGLSPAVGLALSLGLLLVGMAQGCRPARRGVHRLQLGEERAVELHGPGWMLQGQWQHDSWLTRWLIVLVVQLDNGQRLHIPIWPDSSDADSLRRLRVRLRHGGMPIGKR